MRRDKEESESKGESEDDEGDSEEIEEATTNGDGFAGEQSEKEVEAVGSKSVEDFFDAEKGGAATDEDTIVAMAQPIVQKKEKSSKVRRVDPHLLFQILTSFSSKKKWTMHS
ncbi:hypothetical protein Dimus_022212, partial [Dionaea muscipula]